MLLDCRLRNSPLKNPPFYCLEISQVYVELPRPSRSVSDVAAVRHGLWDLWMLSIGLLLLLEFFSMSSLCQNTEKLPRYNSKSSHCNMKIYQSPYSSLQKLHQDLTNLSVQAGSQSVNNTLHFPGAHQDWARWDPILSVEHLAGWKSMERNCTARFLLSSSFYLRKFSDLLIYLGNWK